MIPDFPISTIATASVVGLIGVLFLSSISAKRMHWVVFGLTFYFIIVELSLLEPFRDRLLLLRWPILILFFFYCIMKLAPQGHVAKLDGTTLLIGSFFGLTILTAFTSSFYPTITLAKSGTFLLLVLVVFIGIRSYVTYYENGPKRLADHYGFFAVLIIGGSAAMAVLLPGSVLLSGWFKGIFRNPNFMGAAIIAFCPFLFYKYINPFEEQKRRIFLVLMVVATVMLITTHSRSCLFAFSVALFTLMLVFNRKFLPLLLLLAFVSSLFFYSSSMFNFSLSGEMTVVDTYIYKHRDTLLGNQRSKIQEMTMENIREHPFLGIGFGISFTEKEQYLESIESGYLLKREKGNSYLGILEETGVFGLLIFVVLIPGVLYRQYKAVRYGMRALPRGDPEVILLLTFFTANIGLVVNSGFEAWLISVGNPICIFFWANVISANALADRIIQREQVLEEDDKSSEVQPLPIPVPPRQIPDRPTGKIPQSDGFTY